MLQRLSRPATLLLLFALTSCQANFGAGIPDSAAATTEHVFFLVRHGEKCTDQGDDPELTEAGIQRSLDLARTLKEIPLDAIYSTPFRRTLATAQPAADMHSLEIIQTPVASGFLETLAEQLMAGNEKYVLVSGHSNTTPKLVNLLAGTELDDLPDDVYDRLYVIETLSNGDVDVLTLGFGDESAALTTCQS